MHEAEGIENWGKSPSLVKCKLCKSGRAIQAVGFQAHCKTPMHVSLSAKLLQDARGGVEQPVVAAVAGKADTVGPLQTGPLWTRPIKGGGLEVRCMMDAFKFIGGFKEGAQHEAAGETETGTESEDGGGGDGGTNFVKSETSSNGARALGGGV